MYIKPKTSKNGNLCYGLASKLLIQSPCNFFLNEREYHSTF